MARAKRAPQFKQIKPKLNIGIKSDIEEVTKYLTAIEKRKVPQAASRSLNHAYRKTQTQIVRSVAGAFGMLQKRVRARISIKNATPKRLKSRMRLTWWPEPYIRLPGKAKETKKGVRAGGHVIAGGFIAVMKSGHHHVMRRKEKPRLPISEPKIHIADRANELAFKAFKSVARMEFIKEFRRLLSLSLKRSI